MRSSNWGYIMTVYGIAGPCTRYPSAHIPRTGQHCGHAPAVADPNHSAGRARRVSTERHTRRRPYWNLQ